MKAFNRTSVDKDVSSHGREVLFAAKVNEARHAATKARGFELHILLVSLVLSNN